MNNHNNLFPVFHRAPIFYNEDERSILTERWKKPLLDPGSFEAICGFIKGGEILKTLPSGLKHVINDKGIITFQDLLRIRLRNSYMKHIENHKTSLERIKEEKYGDKAIKYPMASVWWRWPTEYEIKILKSELYRYGLEAFAILGNSGIDLRFADLEKVYFVGLWKIRKFLFEGSKIIDGYFDMSEFPGSHFECSHIKSTSFYESVVRYCRFDNAILEEVDFSESICESVSFENAIIKNVDFIKSKLGGSSFKNAQLINVNFESANLEDATFENTVLENVSFKNAEGYGDEN